MKKYILLTAITIACILACNHKKQPKVTPITTTVNWQKAQEYYLQNLDSVIVYLTKLKTLGSTNSNSKQVFKQTRAFFKKAEPFAAYLNPEVGHKANGPALPLYQDDSNRVMAPVGLQKIEESIYEGGTKPEDFNKEVQVTIGLINLLRKNVIKREVTPERFFIATHQQLLRIIAFSVTGFDTPVSKIGLTEAAISLQSLKQVYQLTLQNSINQKDNTLHTKFIQQIDNAINYLNTHTNFDDFDRYTFIRDYMNPITRNWVSIRKTSKLWNGSNNFPFNFDAPTFFESNSFNTAYFLPTTNRNINQKQIDLGKKLFFDTNLSANKTMSCATCHLPEKAYTDGQALGLDNKGNLLARNTPTLINSVYQKAFFWDGRSENLIDQIVSVFNNKNEFNAGIHQFSNDILKDTTYIKLFKESYGHIPNRNNDVIKALSSYISTLNAFNAKFDQNIRGEANNFTEEEKLGFNLFTGKALCATCHFIPLTNGTVPPFYNDSEKEVIGVPETAANKKLDNDTGFYWFYKNDIHKGMFKTPTVRNAAVTGPYMHNGVYQTLEQVVDFYNKGGGLGFDLPHQTLPFDNLQLTEQEQKALVAFMKTLTDTNVSDN